MLYLIDMAITEYFVTSEHQFGFKKGLSCRHVIYSVRNVIEHYVANGSTVCIWVCV